MILSALRIGSLIFTFHIKMGQLAAYCGPVTAQNRTTTYEKGSGAGSVWRRGCRGATSLPYNYLEGNCSKEAFSLFSQVTSGRMRNNGLKLYHWGSGWIPWRVFLWIEWSSIGMGLPGKWWSPHPWCDIKGHCVVMWLSGLNWCGVTKFKQVFPTLDDSAILQRITQVSDGVLPRNTWLCTL